MPVPSRSISLREPRTGLRPRPGSQDAVVTDPNDRPGVKQLSRTTSTSVSASNTAGGPRGIPSRTKSISTKPPSSSPAENSTASTRSTASRRSLLPQPRTLRAETITGPLQPQTNNQSESEAQQERDALPQDPSTPRSKSLAQPAEPEKPSPAGSRTGLSVQTPKSSTARPAQKTPSSTRLERSASLRQPTTPRPSPASHARHRSQVISSSANPITRGIGPLTPSSLRSPIKQSFSTPPQHSSPRKLSHPPTPTSSKFSTNENASLPSHVISLQTELLQLQLLHSQALQAKTKWERNNEKHFRALHDSAAANYREVVEAEKAIQRRLNVAAINQWRMDIKANKGRYDHAEQIQILSRVLQDVTDLTESQNGMYTLTMRRFEEWLEHVMDVRHDRERQQRNMPDEEIDLNMDFIDPLDAEWKEGVDTLTAKVELCSRELDCLDIGLDVQEGEHDHAGSALFRTMKGHRTLLASMLDELQTVARLEMEVLEWERVWVKNAVDKLGSTNSETSLQHCPIWERM